MTLAIGSLFSGIGGLELGLERAGVGHVVWQCEIDPFCRSVLAKHWPTATRYEDVTRPRDYPHVDLICGGFPCQDVSSAGGRRGLGGSRSGLWYHFASVISKVRPAFVVVENVASGVRDWLPSVRRHLCELGYRSRAFGISAEDIGAPHLRKRVFVVATAHASGQRLVAKQLPGEPSARHAGAVADVDRQGESAFAQHAEVGGASQAADAHQAGREGPRPDAHEGWARPSEEPWRSPLGGLVPVVHGLPRGLARRRRQRIRALGNSVVPQCAEAIGRMIVASLRTTSDPTGAPDAKR